MILDAVNGLKALGIALHIVNVIHGMVFDP